MEQQYRAEQEYIIKRLEKLENDTVEMCGFSHSLKCNPKSHTSPGYMGLSSVEVSKDQLINNYITAISCNVSQALKDLTALHETKTKIMEALF